MRKIPLILFFCMAAFFAFCLQPFFPQIKFMAFSPFLVLLITKKERITALFISLGTGLLIDCSSSSTVFGTYSLIYCLTTALLYGKIRHLCSDKAAAFSLFTFLFSLVSTSIELCFLHIFNEQTLFSFHLLITDLLFMPFLDALYAFFWFTCPIKLMLWGRRISTKKEEEDAESIN